MGGTSQKSQEHIWRANLAQWQHAAKLDSRPSNRGLITAMCGVRIFEGCAERFEEGELGLVSEVTCSRCRPLVEKRSPLPNSERIAKLSGMKVT